MGFSSVNIIFGMKKVIVISEQKIKILESFSKEKTIHSVFLIFSGVGRICSDISEGSKSALGTTARLKLLDEVMADVKEKGVFGGPIKEVSAFGKFGTKGIASASMIISVGEVVFRG